MFAYLVSPRTVEQPNQVVIEFVSPPSPDHLTPVADIDEAESTTEIQAAKASATPGVLDETPSVRQAAAMRAILAMDLTSLRANPVRANRLESQAIQVAGFAPIGPSIHLTGGEVDSLVSQGHDYGEQDRKKGVYTQQRSPTVCIPQR